MPTQSAAIRLSAPDRFNAELDRARPRRAGGGYGNGRALRPEAIRKMLGYRAEEGTARESRGNCSNAQARTISSKSDQVLWVLMRRQSSPDGATPSPLAQRQGTADPGNPPLLPMADSAIASSTTNVAIRSASSVEQNGSTGMSHSAGDRRLKTSVGETSDVRMPDEPCHQLGPVFHLADAERGEDAHSGHNDRGPSICLLREDPSGGSVI